MKSLRTVLSFTLLTLFGTSLPAQLQVLQRANTSLKATVNVLEDVFTLQESSSPTGLILDLQLELKDSEFFLSYQLEALEEDQHYEISIDFQLDGEILQARPGYISGDLGKIIPLEKNLQMRIVWTDLLEQYLNLEGELTVSLSAELWGKPALPYNIDCDNPPQFAFQQKWPHYAAGLAGLGAAGTGYLLFRQANRIYDNDYLASTTESSAEAFYLDANQKRHTSLILMYSGAGLVLVDAVGYIVRQVRYQNRQEAFDTYCTQNNISLRPALISPGLSDEPAKFGLKLTYGF